MDDKEETNGKRSSEEMERSPKRITRQLRDRKERKVYTDYLTIGDADDDIEGPQSFDLEEKLNSLKFDKKLVRDLTGQDFNLAYIQQHGFTEPLVFHRKEGLGIRIPGPNFSVSDVKTCVGSKRLLDVMDVKTQKNMEMTMKQWQEYYDKENKDRLLNVISLEFSHTKLENFVEAPTVVRQLDWVDRVWPRHLKNMQTESTNVMDEMMYPKVQKYCLMSVKGCYTDFHVDFGGTSVWYHILKGAKVFWLIPPTDKNLESYQQWVLSGKQGDTFFGDNVEICSRVYLQSGDTFFIPSGWIHAVYTPKDSLVFGGNFLHSFGIEKQLKIATVEEQTKVPQKFRYPFFTEMLWYTLERYVHCLLGQSFIRIPADDDDENQKDWKPTSCEKLVPDDIALSPQELLGLKAIVLYLHQLPIQRKNVPALIYDPVALLKSIRQIVEQHRYDNPAKAVTGKPILVWPGERAEDVGRIAPVRRPRPYKQNSTKSNSIDSDWADSPNSNGNPQMERRVKCGKCQPCRNLDDCGQCGICVLRLRFKDVQSDKFRKKMCIMRECMAPILQKTVVCSECGLDGWNEHPNAVKLRPGAPVLMECSICWKVVHPVCIGHKANPNIIAIVNDDLPNSWECPLCLEKVKAVRPLKRRKSVDEKPIEIANTDLNNSTLNPATKVEAINGSNNLYHPPKPFVSKPEMNNSPVPVSNSIANVKEEKKPTFEKSARDDEDRVKQKLDEVVRRKSTEEAAKVIAGKMNAAIKRTLSTSSEGSKPKFPRRLSDDSNGIVPTPTLSLGSILDSADFGEKKESAKKVIKKEPVSDAEEEKSDSESKKPSPVRYPFRMELSNKIMNASGKQIKKPSNVIRPAPSLIEKGSKKKLTHQAILKEPTIWVNVFKWLDIKSLNRVLLVSKDWNKIAVTPELWRVMDLSHRSITADLLKGLVRRQPAKVILNWTKISKMQLFWLISRLPQLTHLSLQGSCWNTVSALKTCFCPTLTGLDLGYVDNLVDSAVRELLAPPSDSRPGLTDSKSRLRNLSFLNLSGAHLSDVSLRYVTQHAVNIKKLDLSCCPRITDAGIAQLGAPDSSTIDKLTHLYITGCPQLTNISLDHLKRCKKLVFLDIKNIPQITIPGLSKFLRQVEEAESKGLRKEKMVVKHSLQTNQLDMQNLHQNFYQSEMVSSTNSLTSPSPNLPPPPPYVSTIKKSSGGSGLSSSVVVSIMP